MVRQRSRQVPRGGRVGEVRRGRQQHVGHGLHSREVRLLHDPPGHREAPGQQQRRHSETKFQRRHLPHQQRPERGALRVPAEGRGRGQRSRHSVQDCLTLCHTGTQI